MTLEELYRLLRTDHVQAQGIVDTLQEPLLVLDKALCVLNANPAFYRHFRSEREDTIGKSLFELGNHQWDNAELRRLLADVVPKASAIVGYQVTHDFPDLGTRTMLISARKLTHPDDNSTQILVVFEDVTARNKADATKDFMLAEMRHRMKNLMAIVRAVAHQTKVDGRTGEEYRDIFMGRFEAVLNAQEIASSGSSDAGLAVVAQKSLQTIAGSKARVSPGPEVILAQDQVLPVSMILHELTTNALKHGSLSVPTGTVHLGWSTEDREGQTFLLLDWKEVGGPAVSPPTRRGFGTELIDYSTRSEGGEAAFDFDPSGLRAKISLLLDR